MRLKTAPLCCGNKSELTHPQLDPATLGNSRIDLLFSTSGYKYV